MSYFCRKHDELATKSASRGRRHQFSMRALLIVITMAGLAFGWGHWARRQREAVASLEKSNPSASVYYDYQTDSSGELVDTTAAGGFAWLHDRRRVDYFFTPTFVDLFYATNADLACLAQLPTLRQVVLERSIDLTDDGLKHLSGLRHLRALTILHGDRITDAGLRHLESVTSLEELRLDVESARVTREAIERLKRALPGCRIETSDDSHRDGGALTT